MNSFDRKILPLIIVFLFLSARSYGQDIGQILGDLNQVYGGSAGGLMAGFSWSGIVGGLIFSTIGFVAFVYGKKNSEFKPMAIGILLMAYPYFISNTVVLFLMGIVLTSALYIL